MMNFKLYICMIWRNKI